MKIAAFFQIAEEELTAMSGFFIYFENHKPICISCECCKYARLPPHRRLVCSLLPAFGFCEYKEPESTLRSLRLLHELQIGEKKLLVKVDAKTKSQLDEWKAKKKSTSENGVSVTV